jgi:hypothetical protein
LSDQLLVGRGEAAGHCLNQVPLGRARQRDSQFCCSRSSRWKGRPLPYFNKATILAAVAAYFSGSTCGGASG